MGSRRDPEKLRLLIEFCRLTAERHLLDKPLPPIDPDGTFRWDDPQVQFMFEAAKFLQIAQVFQAELDGGDALPERFAEYLGAALQQFGRIPEGKEIPNNGVTLWKAMIHGWDRVADHLRQFRER